MMERFCKGRMDIMFTLNICLCSCIINSNSVRYFSLYLLCLSWLYGHLLDQGKGQLVQLLPEHGHVVRDDEYVKGLVVCLVIGERKKEDKVGDDEWTSMLVQHDIQQLGVHPNHHATFHETCPENK